MNASPRENSAWTHGRFLGVVGILFALQVGLIVLFGERAVAPVAAPAPLTRFRAVVALMSQDQLRRLFFAGDPAVFPLPSPHGFSGRAWMDRPSPQYHPADQLEAPHWLALDAAQLGTGAILDNDKRTAPVALASLQIPQLESLPVFLSPVIIPTQSVFRIEGQLAQRLLGPPPALHAWPSANSKLLANTVVEIAVDGAGDVLAARLLTRCGSPEADVNAVAKAWALRFRPTPSAPAVWGRAVFDWRTMFPAPAETPP